MINRMKRGIWIASALVAAFAVGALFGINADSATRGYAAKKRERLYQSALASYTQALKPGRSRQDVENYLRERGVVFGKDGRNPNADITLIGAEDSPWYCDDEDVLVAFLYADEALKGISIERRLGQCL
jgi:hypothetical protein